MPNLASDKVSLKKVAQWGQKSVQICWSSSLQAKQAARKFGQALPSCSTCSLSLISRSKSRYKLSTSFSIRLRQVVLSWAGHWLESSTFWRSTAGPLKNRDVITIQCLPLTLCDKGTPGPCRTNLPTIHSACRSTTSCTRSSKPLKLSPNRTVSKTPNKIWLNLWKKWKWLTNCQLIHSGQSSHWVHEALAYGLSILKHDQLQAVQVHWLKQVPSR